MRLHNPFKRKTDAQVIEEEIAQAEVIPMPETIPVGKVHTTKPPTWQADHARHGGRVVKGMPRSLRKIKPE